MKKKKAEKASQEAERKRAAAKQKSEATVKSEENAEQEAAKVAEQAYCAVSAGWEALNGILLIAADKIFDVEDCSGAATAVWWINLSITVLNFTLCKGPVLINWLKKECC